MPDRHQRGLIGRPAASVSCTFAGVTPAKGCSSVAVAPNNAGLSGTALRRVGGIAALPDKDFTVALEAVSGKARSQARTWHCRSGRNWPQS
jgi:hypothetical protein